MSYLTQNNADSGSSGGNKKKSNSSPNYTLYEVKNGVEYDSRSGPTKISWVGSGSSSNNSSSNNSSSKGTSSYRKSSGYSSGSGGTSYDTSSSNAYSYPDLSGFYRARYNSIVNGLKTQRDNAIAGYEAQRKSLGDDYQTLRNQSEVERYKAQGKLRNALADRGALDSGAGRTETLNMQTNYGNALNKINLQEQAANEELDRAIADVNAQYNQGVSDAKSNLYGDIADWLTSISPMQVDTSNYYNTAQGYIQDGNSANVGSNMGSGYNYNTNYPGYALATLNGTGWSNDDNDTNVSKLLQNAIANRVLSNYNN